MDNPKIRIESDGVTAVVYLNGEKIRCTSLDFHGDADENRIYIKWDGTMQIADENGNPIIRNGMLVTEEFHYDSSEAAKE